jgi:hypothetical protein
MKIIKRIISIPILIPISIERGSAEFQHHDFILSSFMAVFG